MEDEQHVRLSIQPQPDATTCGPTSLHAVYRFFGDAVPLEQVVREVPNLPTGGTLGVHLACHALARGYRASIYTYNLHMFDPTWFRPGVDLPRKLRAQAKARGKEDFRHAEATAAYLRYLSLGGKIWFREMRRRLLKRYLRRRIPVLTGLSATYLYRCARERNDRYDDLRGSPQGHFVVLRGYDPARRLVSVADPLRDNPTDEGHYYEVGIDRLMGAILLGIVTYDANLLVIRPGRDPGTSGEE